MSARSSTSMEANRQSAEWRSKVSDEELNLPG